MTGPVIVVGNTAADLFVEVHHFPEGTDREFGPASLAVVEHAVRLEVGGNAGRSASWLRHLGLEVLLLTRLGGDVWGSLLRAELERTGVSVVSVAGTETSTNFVATDRYGNRTSFFYPGEADYGRPDVREETSLVAITACPFPSVTDLAEWVPPLSDQGVPVFVDPGPALVGRPDFNELTTLAGPGVYLALNSAELADLTGQDDLGAGVHVAHEYGFPTLVVKLGERGALVSSAADGRALRVPASPMPSSAPTVGAGDAFNAGFLFGLVNGWDLCRAAAFGNRVAHRALRQDRTPPDVAAEMLSNLDDDLKNIQEV